ncbi:hypothetical protein JTB14_032774 [Gonioctena quinquepunctata]|nr:hypothetical protein JTB14_032774 [Gonioctena quinquepunctata]
MKVVYVIIANNAVRDKIESFAGSINELVGAGVITISNDTVGISKAAVGQAIQSYVNLDSDNTTNTNDVDGGSKAEVHSSSNDKISDNDGNDEGRSSSDSGHVVQTDTISQYNETTEEPNVESESEAEISPDFKEKHPSAASDEFIQSFKNLDSENDDRIEISDVEEEENGGSNDQPDLLEDMLVTVLDENRVDGRSDLIASSRGLVSTVTSWLNEKLKTWLNNKFSSLNTYIGKLLTYPLRFILNVIINRVYACTSCISLVFCLNINWSAASASVDRPSQNGRELLSDILRRTAGDSLSSRQRRAVPGDILQVLLNALVRTQTDRISDLDEKYDAAGDRISAFADWFNGFAGYDVLVVSNTTVSTNSTAIIKVLEAIAAEQVQKKYSGNVLMLTFATSFVNSIIETTVTELNVSLDKSVSLDLVKNLVAVTTLNSTTTSASNSTISRKRRDAGFPLEFARVCV